MWRFETSYLLWIEISTTRWLVCVGLCVYSHVEICAVASGLLNYFYVLGSIFFRSHTFSTPLLVLSVFDSSPPLEHKGRPRCSISRAAAPQLFMVPNEISDFFFHSPSSWNRALRGLCWLSENVCRQIKIAEFSFSLVFQWRISTTGETSDCDTFHRQRNVLRWIGTEKCY